MSPGLAQTFGALADPSRLAVVRLLREAPRRSGDIADALALSRPAASRHLRVLRQAGLVEAGPAGDDDAEADARARVYRLRAERFAALRDWLDEVEAFWGDQLGAFAAHAERGRRR